MQKLLYLIRLQYVLNLNEIKKLLKNDRFILLYLNKLS